MTLSSYLLDTNILSDLVRHPQGIAAQKIAVVGENAVCTSIIADSPSFLIPDTDLKEGAT